MGSLSSGSQKPGQVSIHGEPPHTRWEFSLKRRERERQKESERESTRGKPVLPVTGPTFIVQKGFLYFWLYIEING